MGSFTFKWEHPATDVYITGTFDNWSKSEKLTKTGDIFEKTVSLPEASNKIYYKFVVDGNWIVDHTAPQENDESGNLNNVLTPERISKHTTHSTPAAAAVMSSAAPQSTTAELAKDVPLEDTVSSDLPGAFPETPAPEGGPSEFSVNPIPATEGAGNPIQLAPGEKVPEPSTLTSNTIDSTVKDDLTLLKSEKPEEPEEQSFGVNPLPATAGIGNPIKLAAGEKVPEPSTFTNNTIESTVSHDKSTYENGTGGAPFLPPVVTPANERASTGAGVFDVPEVTKNLIPESSLPMGTGGEGTYDATPTIQSVGPGSTTAALAAAVPLESEKPVESTSDVTPTIQSVGPESTTAALADAVPLESEKPGEGVPEVVKESQAEAGVEPEASADPNEVAEKSAVEKELLSEVPKAPSTAEGTAGEGTDKSESTVTAGEAAAAVGGAAVAVGGSLAAAAYAAKDKAVDAYNHSNATGAATETTDVVPEVVKESQVEAGVDPEASAIPAEVVEKSAVEKELLSQVPTAATTSEGTADEGTVKSESTVTAGEAAAAVGSAAVAVGSGLAAAAYAAKDKAAEALNKTDTIDTSATGTSETVPEVVKESQAEAGVDPEASAIPAEVVDKSTFEKELISEVPLAPSTSEGTAGKGTEKSEKGVTAGEAAAAVGGAAVAVGGGIAAAAYAAKDKVVETYQTTDTTEVQETAKSVLPSSTGTAVASAKSALPVSVQESIDSVNIQSDTTTAVGAVPEVVRESIAESGKGPEAAAFQEPVAEKKAVENELLSELKPENSTGEPAPQISEKQELPIQSLGTTDGLNADASTKAAGKQPEILSDAAPSVPSTSTQTAPVVTDGVASATTAETSAPPKTPVKDDTPATTTSPAKSAAPTTPAKDTLPGVNVEGDSSAAASTPVQAQTSAASPTKNGTDSTPAQGQTSAPTSPTKNGADSASTKKNKRLSFFGKIKAKFSGK